MNQNNTNLNLSTFQVGGGAVGTVTSIYIILSVNNNITIGLTDPGGSGGQAVIPRRLGCKFGLKSKLAEGRPS